MSGDAKGYLLRSGHADLVRAAGYDVLLFDFNGFGESEDGKFEFPGDIVAAGHKAAELSPELPVALLGMSMGAGYGVCAIDTPGHPFKAAVIESAFTSLDEYWRKFRFAYVVLRMMSALFPKTARTLRPIERIATAQGVESILFIYGDADSSTPASMGERLLAACPLPENRRTLWVVPGGKHLRALNAAPDEYRRRVAELFDSVFGKARGAAVG
jgi:pimeloyl-ACP methyl ester carboxylesterase